MTTCRCEELQHLDGAEAREYARAHLVKIKVDLDKWQILYECPNTGKLWKEYYPYPDSHGGGPPELVQISLQAAQEEFHLANPS
jgi:hypothetical protein